LPAGSCGTITRRIFMANLVVQAGIVVTGALVRLTGSGLGCPTWPECAEGSLVPQASQLEGYTKFIEFGNRLLTFLIAAVAIAAIVAAIRHRPRRKPLIALAVVCFLGIAGQAVIGGITVLTGLNPYSVSAHFLLSAVLIAISVALYERSKDAGDGPITRLVRPELAIAAWIVVWVGFAVVVLGVVVTGSGPHSGDADVVERFPLDPRTVSWLHADIVLLFLGLTVGLLLGLRLVDGPRSALRRTWWLLAILLAQGFIGYTQYFTGLPEILVALHVLGACLVWIAVLRIPYALRTRAALSVRT
jgi:cytochrome c oxidase assembly protein subunit 15